MPGGGHGRRIMNFVGIFPPCDERNRDAGSFLPYSIVLSAFGYESYSYSYYSPTPPKKKRKSRSLGKGKVFVSEKDQDCQRWPQRNPPGGEGRAGFGEGLYQCYGSWAWLPPQCHPSAKCYWGANTLKAHSFGEMYGTQFFPFQIFSWLGWKWIIWRHGPALQQFLGNGVYLVWSISIKLFLYPDFFAVLGNDAVDGSEIRLTCWVW